MFDLKAHIEVNPKIKNSKILWNKIEETCSSQKDLTIYGKYSRSFDHIFKILQISIEIKSIQKKLSTEQNQKRNGKSFNSISIRFSHLLIT